MKKYVNPPIWAVSALLLLYLGCQFLAPKEKESPLSLKLDRTDDGAFAVRWDKSKNVDSVLVKWIGAGEHVLGQAVTTENQVLVRGGFADQLITFVATPYSGGVPYQTTSLQMYSALTTPVISHDSVGTVDIIIQRIAAESGTGTPFVACTQCFQSVTPDEFCDGTWFDTGTPTADEYYRIRANGRRADDTPVSIIFVLKVTPAGNVEYLPNSAVNPCITLMATNVTQAARVSVYDNNILAFEMHSTQSADATPIRGVLLRSLKNVDNFSIEKVVPCPPR